MSETIQVIRVEIDEEWWDNGERLMRVYAVDAHEATEVTVAVGDVIELTERMIGQGDPVWPAKFYISEPVPVDD